MNRLWLGLFFSVLFACTGRFPIWENKNGRYPPYIFGGLLPILVAMDAVFLGAAWLAQSTIVFWTYVATFFSMFLYISVYFALLMLALPTLRRHIGAGACAMLWMVPNFLYITVTGDRNIPAPLWVISWPETVVQVLSLMWLAGALGVLGWKIASHLMFRARILKGAEEVSDPAMLAVWEESVAWSGMKNTKFGLVTSPQATTPMTIGLLPGSVRVVLPQRNYTQEELTLIFRHELVHINRGDAWNKFSLVFCTAICWFNPLMWVAMGKSAEDLELSCDETVLTELEAPERRQYADLILRTAGDGRGFTTCLSASAAALRYRLKNIVKPPKRYSGFPLVGAVFFVLFLSSGVVTFSGSGGRGEDLIYLGLDECPLVSVLQGSELAECRDAAGLRDYLSARTLRGISGYSLDGDGTEYHLQYDTQEGILSVTLWKDFMKVKFLPQGESYAKSQCYVVDGGLDWEILNGFFQPEENTGA